MKSKLFLIIFFIFSFNNLLHSDESKCTEFKKFSVNYIKCKSGLLKNKTISAGKNFLEDTKKYQKKEWSKEGKKINKIKEKIVGQ
tara:strand:- start:1842 stop:2096 length:255 start_codon:yes stop_codon:yes gene_type:complete